ncbi:unnamed protein product [Peronospora belbahrii]|uniref:SUN domain-containing protein n=1 Tax=Peronospora belbahrii TaxID=622444 RepID=A0ABN8CTB9_9STRA|nr:unnamed protein product [Peronospora belbahrii]
MRLKERDLLVLLTLVALASVRSIVTPDPSSEASSEASSISKINDNVDPLVVDSLTSKVQEKTSAEDAEMVANAHVEVSFSPQHVTEIDEPIGDHKLADEDVDPLLDVPSRLFEVVDADSVDTRKRQNYASLDAGATILDASPDAKSPTNLLVPDKDRYMLTPCSNPRKWVVISLSEDVHADAIAVANYEKFSSPVKDFIVLGSVNYPTDTWLVLGNFTATHTNGEQIFQLDAQQHVRYIKFRFLSYYGSEYYCTMSQLRVFGRTFTQVISELEKSIDAEVEALDVLTARPAPPVSALPDNAKVSLSRISDPTELRSQCLMEQNNTVVAVFFDKQQQIEYYRNHGMCCIDDYTPKRIEAEAVANEHLPDHADDSAADDAVQTASTVPSTNASSVPEIVGSGVNNTTPISGAVSASLLPAAHSNAVSTSQGLGPLESIFVRITKKIQALEANQSVMGKQFEELQTHQWAAINMLQSNQESVNGQLEEIRTMIGDLKENVINELSANEQTLLNYGRLLDDVRRDNVALWNEMLMCKERADLREWFWRMENHESNVCDTSTNALMGTNIATGALRVNRKAQFGSSWDDSAIERKTLVSDMVGDGLHKFTHHRTKSSSQSSKRHRK